MRSRERYTPATLNELRTSLLNWYDECRRDLPWRKTKDAYRVWVSEIMLQQTRVAAVLEHYRRFLERFPNVETLAAAKEADVLAAWSGLGYYRRARAMHAAAKVIAQEFRGKLPRTPEALEKLPGIGRYTAAAISSIAFGAKAAVVDGNVERVLSRLEGKRLRERSEAWQYAQILLDVGRPGDWNQAVMELGATVCDPMEPKCFICPIQKWCKEPGMEVKKAQAPRRSKELVYGLALRSRSVYLVQRSHQDSLMAGMWDLPLLADLNSAEILHRLRHSITNNDFRVSVVSLKAAQVRGGKWVRCSDLPMYPVTGLARKILRKANLWPLSGI